ncbi:hypothetical protein I307_00570 [Cryptococcus deuterogattii 99/473]|uniref:Uncharacterized protein n=1 Tax=Cryptococcus deuterogattii Ram5 TaxID=1296110 RepID=A0A0D0T758_9TREE|nr:hypothetical protein I352_04263 [Cryptococcus deuterogattii MMRL2647]KIR41762.1 hypothetical protein I313_01922 [Cryptococcus deuterogattii Ram5]KIY60124.1 hypothetical protein I307_00570 [Cryptococcus deuterogattii 99/473]
MSSATQAQPPTDNPAQPPSTLHRARVNAAYLLYGSKAAVVPASLTTRSALTTARYVLRYVPGIGVGMGIGVITAILKFGWRHRGNHFRGGIWEGWQGMKTRAQQGKDGAEDEELDATSAEEQQLEAENRDTRRDVWMRV